MGLEAATYINELVATNPVGATDPKSQGDDHLRLIKAVLQATFPNISGAMTSSHTELNILDGAALTTVELNLLAGASADIQSLLGAANAAAARSAIGALGSTEAMPIGVVLPYSGAAAPSGFLICKGDTIGDTGSGATFEDSTYETLFNLIKVAYGNAGTEDFSAGNTVLLPDLEGRVIAGKEASATRLTSGGSGVDGATLGSTGGAETHLLLSSESGLPAHAHNMNMDNLSGLDVSSGGGWANDGFGFPADRNTDNNAAANAASAHQNTQPTMIMNYIIKT